MYHRLAVLILLFLSSGCRVRGPVDSGTPETDCEYADYFSILYSSSDSSEVAGVVSISPYDGCRDTLLIDAPLDEIICMSTSGVASLAAVGADSSIVAVSGLKYITNPAISDRGESGDILDIGYESSLNYETVLRLNPDLLIAYTVGDTQPPYLMKLRRLGIRVLVVFDHMEHHPLARAEYVKLYGALTGRLASAEEFFTKVRDNYIETCTENSRCRKKVLLNVPYADVWYVPGTGNYMSRLIRDAGGEVLGSMQGTSASEAISMEDAYRLSLEADIWLCPGHCRTRSQLSSFHHLFPYFGPLAKNLPVFNNILRTNPSGGNDFYESGSIRPDLILQDLKSILNASDNHAGLDELQLTYFMKL